MLFKTIGKNVTKKQYETIMNIVNKFDKNQCYKFTNEISLDNRHHFSTTYGFEYREDCILLINRIPIVNKTELYIDTEVRYDIILDTTESTVDTIYGCIKNTLNYIKININDIKYIIKPDLKCIYSYKKHQKIIISKIPFYTLYITNIFNYRYCILPFEREEICDLAYPGDIIVFEAWDEYHKYNIIFKLPSKFKSITEMHKRALSLECDTGWISFLNGKNSDSTMIFNGPNFDLKITKLKVITHGEFWKKILNESYEQLLCLKNIDTVGVSKTNMFIYQFQNMMRCENIGYTESRTMKNIKKYMSSVNATKDEIPIRKRIYNNVIYNNFDLISDIPSSLAYNGKIVFLRYYNTFFAYDAFTTSWIPIDTEVSGVCEDLTYKPIIDIHYDAPSHTSAYNIGGYTRDTNREEEARGYEYDEDIVSTEKEIQEAIKTINKEDEARGYEYDEDIVPTEKEIQEAIKTINKEDEDNNIKDILKEMNGKLNSSFNHELT